ncbi:MAG: HU family DNA-binding protein [Bacilli bacterium]|nr:integration host factor subunit beta [Mollicutes bacterium]MDY3900046.1 HU family DNA-binding protein [Bacilli bacterium]
MTKSELIKEIHKNNDYNYVEIESLINQTFETIMNALAKEDKVVISGFGTFEKYYQDGYNGINPATGSKIFVEGSYKIRFNASKKLKSMMK